MYMAMKQTGAPVSLDDNRGPTILGATMTVTIAALITFSARLYVRIYMIKSVGWDVSVRERMCRVVAEDVLGLYHGHSDDSGRIKTFPEGVE
jgi:hypothetical protein